MIISEYANIYDRFPKETIKREEYLRSLNKEDKQYIKLNYKPKQLELDILKFIFKMRITNSNQVKRLFFSDTKHPDIYVSKALKKLYDWGLIDRFFVRLSKGSAPVHVVLDELGANCLMLEKFKKIKHLGGKWKHVVQVSDIYSQLLPKYNIFDWKNEYICNWENGKLRTDAFCKVKTDKGTAYYFIEVDMGTEHSTKLQSKLEEYAKYYKNGLVKADFQPKGEPIAPILIFYFSERKNLEKFKKIYKRVDIPKYLKVKAATFSNIRL